MLYLNGSAYAFVVIICFTAIQCFAQQVADTTYLPSFKPQYPEGQGPVVVIDAAHQNRHTLSGGFYAFGKILKHDGYRVVEGRQQFSSQYLSTIDVLVIANALASGSESALSEAEHDALFNWVNDGGSLFLIADHMPFPAATEKLAGLFGVRFYNAFAFDSTGKLDYDMFSKKSGTLIENEITNGRFNLNEVASFMGQAFSIPHHATSILILREGFKIYLPEIPWQFTKQTKVMDGKGFVQGAYLRGGKGKVVVFGEAAMFTAQLVGEYRVGMNTEAGSNNYKLLLNILQWLSE